MQTEEEKYEQAAEEENARCEFDSLIAIDETSQPTSAPNSNATEKPQQIGSWQCQHCHLTSMLTWHGSPHPDDAPACCGGELMVPYRIPSREALDVKVVSRWIDDIERSKQ